MIAIRLADAVGPAALRAMHRGQLPTGDEALDTLLHQAGVVSIRPVHNLSEAELSLGIAASRDFELTVAPGADEAESTRVLRGSALVDEVSLPTAVATVSGASVAVAVGPRPVPPEPVATAPAGAAGEVLLHAFDYAGFWLRFGAWVIDMIVLVVASGSFFAIAAAIGFAGFGIVAVLLGPLIYYAALESNSPQATVGKMAVGIIVVDMKGRRLTAGRALGRNAAKVITAWVPLGAGWMMAGFTEKKQALHDLIASTLVVRKLR